MASAARLDPAHAERGLRLPDRGLWHQGRARAVPRLAARCPCRGPDADLGGAFGAPAERRALCRPAVQDADGGERGGRRAGAADDRRSACCRSSSRRLMLYRRRDIKRLFAYSSIEHMGIIVFAFGMGGPLANFAGLLHMVMHSLTKSAIFFAVGNIAQIKGTQRIGRYPRPDPEPPGAWLGAGGRRPVDRRHAARRRLHERVPGRHLELRAHAGCWRLSWSLGLLLAFGALLLRLTGIAFGEPTGQGRTPCTARSRRSGCIWRWSC